MRNYNEEDSNFEKFRGGKGRKPKFKGHQSKRGTSDFWARMIENTDKNEVDSVSSRSQTQHHYTAPSSSPQPAPSKFVPGPNTHTIKTNQIDFDRVEEMSKISGDYNGKTTYGIKFVFTGKKGLSRIIWFNINERERDAVYNTEYSFWAQLRKQR